MLQISHLSCLCWLVSLFHHRCSTASPSHSSTSTLPVPQLCFASLVLPSRGTQQPVPNTKLLFDGSSDLMKNREAQEIPPLRNDLCLTIFTCFCPAWPNGIVALDFSMLVSFSISEDLEFLDKPSYYFLIVRILLVDAVVNKNILSKCKS